ncbi:MAG: hypothetical protein KDD36_12200, partial [Flavobacteriales bacterium]|nr:hypothetical protein [Flavobacteriales bacterium]
MTVRNVNIGRKTPTPDQIQRFKDFDQLKSRVDLHEKSREVSGTGASGGGMSRSLWYITGAAAVLLAGFSIFAVFTEETVSNNGVAPQHTSLILGDKPEANETVIEQVEQDRAEFKAPFKHQNIDVDFTEYIVEASEGASLEYTSGTRIIIPAHAFLNNIGRPLKGKVKVRYRELNGAMDIFLAGVPMHYDSAGVRNELESAGMIELRAYQNNGEEVYPNPDNKIRIQLASNETTNSFNLYNFDEKSRNWVYQGKDEVAIFEADENGRSTGKKKSASKKTGKSKQIVPEDEEVKRFGLRNLKNYHPTLRITDKNAYKRQGSLNFMFSDIVTLQPEMAVFDKMVWHYERGIQTDDTRF